MLASLAFVALSSKAKFPLTVASIMRGPALVGHAPRNLRWSADGKQLRFSWAKADGSVDPRYLDYVVMADGSGLAATGGGREAPPVPLTDIERGSKVGDLIAYETGGDLYLFNSADKTAKRLTVTTDYESSPRLSASGQEVTYLSNGNAYRLNVTDGKSVQLTMVKPPEDPAAIQPGLPYVIKAPKGWRNGSVLLSPSGRHATVEFSMFPTPGRRTDVPNYITSSNFPEMIGTFSRVGSPQVLSKALLVNLQTGAMTEAAGARPSRMTPLRWSPDGTHAITVARSDDHKDDWILGFDADSDKVSVLWTEHCDAWVGGPGRGTLGWLPDGSRFYFQSEKDGYANLFTMAAGGGEAKPIVAGPFEVSDVRLDAERRRFTFVSSEGSPFKRHLDTVSIDGGPHRKMVDLSADEDMEYAIAPDGEKVAVVKSRPNRPGELFVNDKQVTVTPTEEWLEGPWIEPEVVWVTSLDGAQVPSRLYKPKKWRKGGPAVIFVHGAGYLQNVYDGWSHYYREYMFHHVLMDKGYIVLDMDYRASAGYGREWRTGIYRFMGGKDLDDHVAGAEWLDKKQGVAKDRLGIYGGSYGGFITLMAMFTKPDVFAAGAALRPVTDWSTYNHGYTSNILNNPQDDKVAYQRSSPINFVEGLKGDLLICHGMVDTNVPFQDSVRVVQRLIDLGKTNWEVAPYPVEDHAFTKASSWADEYRRIFELFERTIGGGRRKR